MSETELDFPDLAVCPELFWPVQRVPQVELARVRLRHRVELCKTIKKKTKVPGYDVTFQGNKQNDSETPV